MSAYEEYAAAVLKFVASKEKEIAFVNANEVPQHILWSKSICGALEDSEAYTKRIDDKFYFTELLVNKLMHFAYLAGTKEIDMQSHRKGWDDCWAETMKKLGVTIEDGE